MTSEKKAPPPYNITLYKGTNNAAISRAFALYFLFSNVSREITDYFADTYIPDEFLWPTLNQNRDLETPGGYFGNIHYIILITITKHAIYVWWYNKLKFWRLEVDRVKEFLKSWNILKLTYE